MLVPGHQSFIGVARDDVLVSDALTSLDAATKELERICSTMVSVGLTPDVRLVTFDVETIIGELTDYVDPTDTTTDDTTTPTLDAPSDGDTGGGEA